MNLTNLQLVNNPPLKLNIFGNRSVKTDGKGIVGLRNDLKILVFATFGDSDIDLGSVGNLSIGKNDIFLVGGENSSARKRIGVG